MSNSRYELNKELAQMLKAFMEHEKNAFSVRCTEF